MKTFAFIFARGGSKRLVRKNVRMLSGKPLITHSIDIAKSVEGIDDIFVSTEDKEIAQIATANGARVIDRPVSLSRDETPELMAWQHAVQWVQNNVGDFQKFVSLPTTAPLRTVADVTRCMGALTSNVDLVIAISPAQHNPWFNMVKLEENNFVTRLLDQDGKISRLQDAPTAFAITTVAYVARPESVLSMDGLFDGRVLGIEIPAERALDIDTEHDFRLAQFLLTNQEGAKDVN